MDLKAHLEHAGKGEDEAAARADEEDGGDVEEEGDGRVGEEDERAEAEGVVEGREALCEGDHEQVDERADLCRVE